LIHLQDAFKNLLIEMMQTVDESPVGRFIAREKSFAVHILHAVKSGEDVRSLFVFPKNLSLPDCLSDTASRLKYISQLTSSRTIDLGNLFHPEGFLTACCQHEAEKKRVGFNSLVGCICLNDGSANEDGITLLNLKSTMPLSPSQNDGTVQNVDGVLRWEMKTAETESFVLPLYRYQDRAELLGRVCIEKDSSELIERGVAFFTK
jgi:hypothetical protein